MIYLHVCRCLTLFLNTLSAFAGKYHDGEDRRRQPWAASCGEPWAATGKWEVRKCLSAAIAFTLAAVLPVLPVLPGFSHWMIIKPGQAFYDSRRRRDGFCREPSKGGRDNVCRYPSIPIEDDFISPPRFVDGCRRGQGNGTAAIGNQAWEHWEHWGQWVPMAADGKGQRS